MLTLSSRGESRSIRSSEMGLYMKTASQYHNYCPVYEKYGGGAVIFCDDYGHWVIANSTASGRSGVLFRSIFKGLPTPPLTDWKYFDGRIWQDDSLIFFSGKIRTISCNFRQNHKFPAILNTSSGFWGFPINSGDFRLV